MSSTSQRSTPERPDLGALTAMVAALGAAHRLDDVLAIAVEEVRVLCGAASVSVSRWEREHGWLRTLINVGDLGPGEQRLPEHELYNVADYPHLVGLLERGRATFVARDDLSCDGAARDVLERIGKPSAMSVPIVVDGVMWGELYATSPADGPRLGAADEPMVRLIAEQLSLAIARAELLERLTALAFCDPLTGLENRRALEDRLEAALSAPRGERPLALVLCDLDNLKAINDGHGHDAGDAALRRVASVLEDEAAALPGTLVCRLGGDEFCLLLDGADIGAARELATRALDTLAGDQRPLGLSIGIASTRLLVDRPADLLRAADGALYAAKRTGRGRICVADIEPSAAWRAAAAAKRRKRRDRNGATAFDLRALLHETLTALDGPLADSAAPDRLEALATTVGGAVDASAVSVSLWPPGASALTTVFTLDRRSGHSSSSDAAVQDQYLLDEYPASSQVLRAASSAIVHVDDPAADPAECALLAQWGMQAVLLAVAVDEAGGWLLEVYADASTHELDAVKGAVRLLVTQAVHGAGRGGAAGHAASTASCRLSTS